MIWRCAWCEASLPAEERASGENVTHGICGDHLIELKRDLAARRLLQKAPGRGEGEA